MVDFHAVKLRSGGEPAKKRRVFLSIDSGIAGPQEGVQGAAPALRECLQPGIAFRRPTERLRMCRTTEIWKKRPEEMLLIRQTWCGGKGKEFHRVCPTVSPHIPAGETHMILGLLLADESGQRSGAGNLSRTYECYIRSSHDGKSKECGPAGYSAEPCFCISSWCTFSDDKSELSIREKEEHSKKRVGESISYAVQLISAT